MRGKCDQGARQVAAGGVINRFMMGTLVGPLSLVLTYLRH